MRIQAIIVTSALIYSTIVQADIYKCTDSKGQVIFSQMPCATDAKKIIVQTYTPTQAEVEGTKSANAQISRLVEQGDKDRKATNLQRRLAAAEQRLRDLTAERDSELNYLSGKKSSANNNLAGAVYENSISTEMQSVSEKYSADILTTQRQISDLRQEINHK